MAVGDGHREGLERAEVVVDESVIDPGLVGDAAGREPVAAVAGEHPLGGVEQPVARIDCWAID